MRNPSFYKTREEAHRAVCALCARLGLRSIATTATELASRWAQWDQYRAAIRRFFYRYDVVICPLYTHAAFRHGESVKTGNFEGFSYTMAWNVAGAPAATVRCAEAGGLPINIQVVTKPWRDLLAIEICRIIEREFGGWQAPHFIL